MEQRILQALLLGMLGLYAVEDIRKRTVTVRYLILFGAVGMGLHLYWRETSLPGILLGIAVGMGMLLLSFLTGGSIGRGDGALLMVTGIFLGGASNVELLLTSLMYAAVFSLGILVFGRRKKNREIPFVPFLFLGYLTMVLETII